MSGATAPGAAGSVGAYLARQRKLRGISLEELEAATRIPRRSLARLEAGAFDGERDAFARGFVRAVADALGLDAEDAVTRMLAAPHAGDAGPSRRAARLRVGRVVFALGIGVAIALAVFLVRFADRAGARALGERLLGGRPVETVKRRDAVRELAEEAERRAALAPPPAPADAAPAAPPADPAPAPGEAEAPLGAFLPAARAPAGPLRAPDAPVEGAPLR